jgi:carboxypeptidase D
MRLLAAFAALLAVVAINGHRMTEQEMGERQREAAKRWQASGSESRNIKHNGVQNITFTNPKASGNWSATGQHLIRLIYVRSEFYVDGKSLPFVVFDVGPSWAGLLPISNSPNETRQVCST